MREGKNLKGRMLGLVLGTIGKRVLTKAFENTVKAIEARNGASKPAKPRSGRAGMDDEICARDAPLVYERVLRNARTR